MAKTHPLFHKFKSVVGYSIAIIVIVSALAVSGLRFILTTANIYQYEVEQLASSLLEQPVKIGRMDAKLSGLIPTLIFHDVKLISKKTNKSLFSLSRIDIGLLIKDLVWQQKITPAQITIRGMNLHVTRTVEGNIKVKGFDLETLSKAEYSESNSLLNNWLLQQSEIGLEESTFTWKDEQNAGLTWFFNDVNFLLKNTHERHQLLLSSKLPYVLGDEIKVAFDLVGELDSPATWDIKTFIESKRFNIIPIQKYIKLPGFELINGIADLKLWVDWKEENIKQLSGDINLYDFSYHINEKEAVSLKYVSGLFDSYLDEDDMWNISVDKFHYINKNEILSESKFSLAFNNNKKVETVYVKANQLKLGVLSKIITDNHLLSQKNEDWVKRLNVRGDIHNLYAEWQDNEILKIDTDFSGFSINSLKHIPKLESLSGSVVYEQQEGIIKVQSKNAIIGFPKLFRDDFKLNNLSADIAFSNTAQGMLFDIKHLTAQNFEANTSSSAKFWMPKNDASPHLDLQMYVSDGDISKISHYLPVSIMEKSLVNWLDNALLKGKVDKSTIVFNGNLSDFPFKKDEGVFAVTVNASDFMMHYKDGWPKIKKAKMQGIFTGLGMKLHLISGEVENNLMYDSYAEIPSFFNAELQLDLAMNGSTKNTVNYLVNSPILPDAKKTMNSMRMQGNIDTKIKINIPLSDALARKKPLSYSGEAKLYNASLFMLDDKIDITRGDGTVNFTEKGLSSKNLSASILGEKALLSLVSSVESKGVKILARGKIAPAVLLKRFDIPGANKISGKTSYAASMNFPEKSQKKHYPKLNLNSDLYGVKSNLPDFFYKRKNTRHKSNLNVLFTGHNKTQLGVNFINKGSAILELDHSGKTTFLNKGAVSTTGKKAILPKRNVLYIDGRINQVTPWKWIKALGLDKGKSKSKSKQTFFVHPIVFNLEKLKILLNENDDDEDSINIDPKRFPAFEGIIKKLYFDKMFIGRLDLKSSKRRYGLHIDELILSAKNMKLFSNGAWRYSRGEYKTNMNITLSSNNFGAMLTELGFAAVIEQGVTSTVANIYWQGAPTQFSLKKLNGKIQLKIKNGNIKEVDAGAGRLLGLFSLSALPRKLIGDFKDTFKSGFNFDQANGEIILENGDAYTDDFEITSAVADIMVSGRTGIADRDYENTVEVVPEIGGGLAGAAAILVNLPAGIGVWLLDKLTGEQLNEASTRIYEISGSWEKPVIERVEEESL